MAEERYVDPNSGAAPQPGGFAGPHAVEAGHGSPNTEVVVPGADLSHEEAQGIRSGDGGSEGVSEQQASADKALETEGVNLPTSSAGGEGQDGADSGDGDSDYSELLSGKVDEVNDYLEAHPDEKDAVVAAEKKGQNRKGIVEA